MGRQDNLFEIIENLTDFGCSVRIDNTLVWGEDTRMLIVGYKGMNLLILPKFHSEETTREEAYWIKNWKGEVMLARTPGHARELVRLAFLTRYCNAITEVGEKIMK